MMNFNDSQKMMRYFAVSTLIMSGSLMTSCVHNDADVTKTSKNPRPASKAVQAVSDSVSVNQIGTGEQILSAPQIQTEVTGTAQLTVDQLRIYADRCLPDSQLSPPDGLDCSEINLRMKTLLRDEDKVINALVTLGQLGRNDTLARTLDDLNDGRSGNSFAGGAIAGGLTNGVTPVPTPSPEPPPELQEFLQENGLSVNQGVISRLPQ